MVDYVSGGSLSANTWHKVTIPLSDLGTASQNLHVVTVENGTTGTVYFDDVSLEQNVATTTYAWTYDNRLASTTEGSNVTTYQYDHTGQRTTLHDSTGTTTYANSLYSTHNGTSTKQIMALGEVIATVEGTGASATVHYVHTDHLGGTNVTTNTAGTLEQVLDYYPFGTIRTDYDTTEYDPRRKFTGHEYDEGTGLYYMRERYQNPSTSRFISIDPATLHVAANSELVDLLGKPQELNSYSYVSNNPLRYVDPTGEKIELVARSVAIGGQHMFLHVQPDNGDPEFTLGAYNRKAYNTAQEADWYDGLLGINVLHKDIGYHGDLSPNSDWGEDGLQVLRGNLRQTISPPDGQNEAEFIITLLDAFSAIENNQSYFTLGNSNSNNFIYELAMRAGFGNDVMAFGKRLFGDEKWWQVRMRYAPGYDSPTSSGGKSNKSSSSSAGKPKSKNSNAPERGGGWEGYAKRRGLIE